MPEPGEPGGPMPESGPPPVAPSPNDTAGKYVGVDSGVDFETPVAPAEPRLQIEGSLEVERLVGTWMEVEADGSRCKTDKLPAIGAGICARLELGTGGAGVGGTIAWQRLTDSALDEGISGPFEPPSDASRGYPQGVGPELYGRLIGAVPRVPYRMLDGTYSEGRLSFWYSPVDLWQEWCALQTPFPYDQYGRKGYRCVPPGATEENAELGPLVLCTSQWDFGTCAERVPCVCQDSSASPLCKPAAMCNCTSAGCAPAVRAFVVKMSIEVDVEAGVMTAVRSFLGKDDRFVLKKVTP
jgi:hypothetical protein